MWIDLAGWSISSTVHPTLFFVTLKTLLLLPSNLSSVLAMQYILTSCIVVAIFEHLLLSSHYRFAYLLTAPCTATVLHQCQPQSDGYILPSCLLSVGSTTTKSVVGDALVVLTVAVQNATDGTYCSQPYIM